MEELTVDLDEDEEPWLVRVIGILDRALQSDFVQEDKTRYDLERLIGMLRAVQESKS